MLSVYRPQNTNKFSCKIRKVTKWLTTSRRLRMLRPSEPNLEVASPLSTQLFQSVQFRIHGYAVHSYSHGSKFILTPLSNYNSFDKKIGIFFWSRDSSVGIATGFRMASLGSIPTRNNLSLLHSLLSNEYRGSFPAAGAWSWQLTCI
jgi:hypothetical protein